MNIAASILLTAAVLFAQQPRQAAVAASIAIAGGEPAAKVGDRIITLAEVDREWQRRDPASYLGLTRQLYDNRRRVLDAMVADELLAREAAARGMTTEALLKEEIPKRIITMPESAVVSLYQSLGDLTRGATLDEMKDRKSTRLNSSHRTISYAVF